MSQYDGKVPSQLKEVQEWFASIITRPIDDCSQMNPLSPSGIPMSIEAQQYIVPSPTLTPDKRIQIYNQQYWWRLLTILHENYPLTTRLFGYRDFNRLIAVPFLERYPPNHWSLNYLGDSLPRWLREEYCGENKELVREAVDVDWAYIKGFFTGELSTDYTAEDEEALLTRSLTLQPHISLCRLTHRLLPFRDLLLEHEPEHWEEADFPPLDRGGSYFYIIYRNRYYNLEWQEIDEPQYMLLSLFENGRSIAEVCEWLEEQSEAIQSAANKNLHLWFQEWTACRWLGSKE